MGYYKLIVPRESAWNVMNELCELDCIHFVDYDPLLPLINRPFANYIKRCDDLLNKVGNIETELKKYKKKISYCKDVNLLIRNFKTLIQERYPHSLNRSKASHTYLEEIESEIEKKHAQLIEQGHNMENLQERRNKLIENKAVLIKGEHLLGQSFFQPSNYQAEGFIDISGRDFDDLRAL